MPPNSLPRTCQAFTECSITVSGITLNSPSSGHGDYRCWLFGLWWPATNPDPLSEQLSACWGGWRWCERTARKQTPICLEEPGASGEVIKILLPTAERKPVINLTAPLIFSVPFTTKHCLLAVSLFSVPSGEKKITINDVAVPRGRQRIVQGLL